MGELTDLQNLLERLGLAAVAAILVVAFILFMLGHPPASDYASLRRRMHSYSIRRAVLRVAEGVLVIQVVLVTLGGALLGAWNSTMISLMLGFDRSTASIWGAVLGGLIGFMLSTTLSAFLFVLTAIEENTRTTALLMALGVAPKDGRK
jgi:hypothetical protein